MKDIREIVMRSNECIRVADFPDINYPLVYRNSDYQPWGAAWGYNEIDNVWGQGHYFETINEKMKYIESKYN